MLDARISIKRVQQHWDSVEKQTSTVPGEVLAFEDVDSAAYKRRRQNILSTTRRQFGFS